MPNPTPAKPIAPDAVRAASDPMGAASQAWAAGVDPAAKAAMQALRASQAVAKRAKQEAALPTMEDEGTAGEEEKQNQPTIQRDIEWSPVSRAIGVLLGAGHGLTPGAAGGFGASYVAGKAQAEADRRERLGEPKTAAETASKWGMNTLTDLWDISTMVPGLAAQVLLPQEAPPGSENETNLERSLRGFGEGAQIGKGVAQGLIGGTADVLEHPLESLAERPWTTIATHLHGLRALKNVTKAAHGYATYAGENPHPIDIETQPGKVGPEVPRTPQLDVRGADVFDRAVSKIKDSFRSVGGKWADQYLAKIANGFHAGDPVVTAFVEDLARGEERADARLKATAEKLAGAVGRDTAKPRAPVHKGKPMPGLPVESQVVVPGEEHLQTEHDLARGLILPEERVVGQEIGGGRKNPLTYSREIEDVNPLGDVPALQPESHPAIEAHVNELMDAANMTDAERRQYKPAIVHDVMMHAADIVGHDGETGNWRGQMHGNPEQFAKDFIASVEERLGRTLDNKERAGILEAIDPRSKDVTEAPRTGLESGAAQEFVHAQEVAPNPEGGVGRAFEPDELTVSEADARKARQKAMDTAERDAMRLRAAAAAHEEHALTAEHEHLRAKAAAAEANYHAVGAADELSNRRSEAQQAKWAAETAQKLARDKAQKAVTAKAAADKAHSELAAHAKANASPEAIRDLYTKPAAPHRQGQSSTNIYVSGENGRPEPIPAKYRLLDADQVHASHNPETFAKNPNYPEGQQERAYHRDREEQNKVKVNASALKPDFIVNTNVDAVNGPPIVDSRGVVYGGNSRAMSTQLAYKQLPAQAQAYKSYLRDNAHQFGLTPEAVDAMRQPMLVREIDTAGRDPKVLVRQMNESFTQAMDPRTMQVALARKLTPDTVATIADAMKPGETLNAYLGTPRADGFVARLSKDGVIDRRNSNQYLDKQTGRLNQDGRQFVAKLLVGSVVPDADLLSAAPPRIMDNLAAAVPYMLQAEAGGEGYSIRHDLKSALDAYLRIEHAGMLLSGEEAKAPNAGEVFNRRVNLPRGMGGLQGDMLDAAHPVTENPRALALLHAIVMKQGANQLRDIFKEYAKGAKLNPENQQGLGDMFVQKKTPQQVFSESLDLVEKADRERNRGAAVANPVAPLSDVDPTPRVAQAAATEPQPAQSSKVKKGSLEWLHAQAQAAEEHATRLADEASELLAEARRAAKVAKVRATEAATAEQRHENVRQAHIAAKKAEGVAKTIYDRAAAKHDQAREAHLAAQAEADKAQAETHKFDARRLVRTSVVPHIDGVPLDPAKLVPPRVLTPAERAKAFQSSFKNMTERYKGRQEMGRQLEAHSNQFETIPDDEVPENFRHTVQVATFDKPTSQLVRGAESKTAAQNTLAKLAYGIVRGIQRGDMRPVVLPQGVRSSFLRGLIESATHDLPEAERAKVQAVARQIGGYLPMDPDTGYGTTASPVWADPLVADAMKWHARANKPGEGVLHEITQALKGNVTGKSLAGGVNNALPNLNGTAIRRGLGPVEFITKAETLMRNLKQWGETGKVESGPVGKAAQKFGAVADDAMQARAFDALAKAGNLSLDFVSKELGERQLSPAEKLRMNKALAWYKDPQTDLPTTKFSKWFYQHGDHILRVEEGVMQFEQKARSIDELKTGQYQDLNVSRNRTVRIGKEGERYTAQDPFAEKAEDRKPRYVSKEKVDELTGQDATYHAAAITQDYGDLSQAAKAVKSLHNKGLEIVTPFVSWADKAKDVPFGAGLLSKTLFQSPYEMSTNNPAALARAARAEAGLALRRAVWVNGVRQQLTQQGSNGPLADAFRRSSEDDQSVIIGNLTHPNVVEGVPLGQAAQFGPTGNIVGGMASLATLAQRLHEESGAKAGTQSEFSKAVQDAVSGKDFSVKKAMRLAYLSGGPLLRIYDALNGNGDAGDVVRSLSNSAIGGTTAGILRAIAGAASDKGQEPHPRLPEGVTSDFLAKASGRNRSLGITPEGSQALIPWLVQQIVGLGWQAKDFDPRDPKAVFQYIKMIKQAFKKGMDVPADKDIPDLPADKADEMTSINDVIGDTVDRINDNYERVYELLSNKGKPPQK